MAKYVKDSHVVTAITFAEFIRYGIINDANIVNGIPWSFKYKGWSVSHETDERYLINTPEGAINFTPNDMLVYDGSELSVVPVDEFKRNYTFCI